MIEPKAIAAALALLGVAIIPASAQRASVKGVPQAFAAVQAPESAVETCMASSARAAQDCALAKCQRKASRGACFAVTSCAPSGWSGVMGVKLKEVHFSQVVCGAPTREAAVAALKAFCQGHLPGLEQCHLPQVLAPDGTAHGVNLTWTAAELKP